ncbi:hypothetical protein OROGR_005722 [Orobanche gracilis]
MDKQILTLDEGTRCTAWNYSGDRLVAGLNDGSLVIYDSMDPASSVFTGTSRFKVRESSILKVVWVPPEYGDAVACISADGTLSLWEEVVEEYEGDHWKMRKYFDGGTSHVLDIQFGGGLKLNTSLVLHLVPQAIGALFALVAAYSDGQIKIYELLDTLELEKWQLQAEFQNVIDLATKFGNTSCMSASISWNPQRNEVMQLSFVLGFSSNTPSLNSPKGSIMSTTCMSLELIILFSEQVWEFDLDHQRWLPVAELSLPEDKSDQVHAVAWASNIGRPYELIGVASEKGISIWHIGSNPDPDGRLSVHRVALLSGHDSEVWQMEWDMSGMTLASTGSDGVVRLWQSNVNGVWHQQAILTPAT